MPPAGSAHVPDPLVEAEQADAIAGAQAEPAEQDRGVDRVIELGHAGDRLAHQLAGVDREHDLVVALGAELLAQQLAVARRRLPVDRAVVEPGHVLAQRLELGAVAEVALDLEAGHEVAIGEHAQRDRAHRAEVRARPRPACRSAIARAPLDQAERAGPARVHRAQRVLAAAARPAIGELGDAPAAGPAARSTRGRGGCGARSSSSSATSSSARLAARRAAISSSTAVPRLADEHLLGQPTPTSRSRARGSAEQRVDAGEQDRRARGTRARPSTAAAEIATAAERQRDPGEEHEQAAQRGSHGYRGAGTCSRIWRTTASVVRPSISAPGASTTRWRSAGHRERLDVVGQHEVAALQRGVRAARGRQHRRGARRGAERDARPLAGRADQVDDVVEDRVADADLLRPPRASRRSCARSAIGWISKSARRGIVVRWPWRATIVALLVARRIADHDLEQEAIELRLGQRVRALLLDRVLRRDHHEAVAELVGRCRRR